MCEKPHSSYEISRGRRDKYWTYFHIGRESVNRVRFSFLQYWYLVEYALYTSISMDTHGIPT